MLAIANHESKVQEVKKMINEHMVELLHLQFVDIEGTLKQVTVTVEQLEDAIEGRIMFDGSSVIGFSPIHKSDLYLQPDLNTFAVLPWSIETNYSEARFLCSVTNPNGTLFEGDTRNILKKSVERASKQGYTIFAGTELEFFLFQKDADGKITNKTQDEAGYAAPSPNDLGEPVRLEIYRALKAIGFTIETTHHERAIGQHEINFKFADVFEAADNAITYKWVVKTIAKKFGLHASFMPKPISGVNGSGMHVNMSFFKGGQNAFYDAYDDLQLSETAYQFIAGLMQNVKNFTAITNPLVNSYKRLIPGYEAPCYIAWSASNRSALIRIPAKKGNATRVELRCPDPSANPYLAFAVIASSGLDGVEKGLIPVDSINDDIFHMSKEVRMERGIEELPGSLEAAIEAFENGDIGLNVLGNHVFKEYISLKKSEWNHYRTVVHSWELEQYQAKF